MQTFSLLEITINDSLILSFKAFFKVLLQNNML